MKSMKVMIYGEGPTDYGWKNKSGKWEEGPAVRLVRKCAFVHDVDLDIELLREKTQKKMIVENIF